MFELAAKERCKECILVIQTQNNDVIGTFTTEPWTKSKLSFYGSGETFVFNVINSSQLKNNKGQEKGKEIFKAYHWTEKNYFFQTSSLEHLGVGGGGGGFALAIDSDLINGTTNPCETFGNKQPLTQNNKTEFSIINLELWSLTSHGIEGKYPGKYS